MGCVQQRDMTGDAPTRYISLLKIGIFLQKKVRGFTACFSYLQSTSFIFWDTKLTLPKCQLRNYTLFFPKYYPFNTNSGLISIGQIFFQLSTYI